MNRLDLAWTFSLNGVIRIWDENKHLVTEIFMDKLEIDENILQEEPGRKKIKVDEQGRKTVEDEGEDRSSAFQDRSLSAACFLNNTGDLIIGFKNHIFFIDHTKGIGILDCCLQVPVTHVCNVLFWITSSEYFVSLNFSL